MPTPFISWYDNQMVNKTILFRWCLSLSPGRRWDTGWRPTWGWARAASAWRASRWTGCAPCTGTCRTAGQADPETAHGKNKEHISLDISIGYGVQKRNKYFDYHQGCARHTSITLSRPRTRQSRCRSTLAEIKSFLMYRRHSRSIRLPHLKNDSK